MAPKASEPKEYTYECLVGEQNDRELYFFFAPAKEIYSFVSINQKQEDADEGYQRAASPARTAAIARYVDAGNVLPLSILVTLEKRAVSVVGSEITIKVSKKSGWVIDGQHRLVGAMKAEADFLLPVVAFVGLSVDEQIQQFVTVNREAKGVPTSLYYSLLKKLPPKMSAAETAKERAADIAMALKADEASPFSARIVSTTSPKNGQLSLVNFVRKVAPLVKEDTGLLGSYNLEDQIGVIDNYYKAVRNVFSKEFMSADPVFFNTIGFGGLFNFFPTIFSSTLAQKQSFAVPDVTEVLSVISHVDPSKWKKGGTGSAAEISLGRDLIEEFRQYSVDPSGHSAIKLK
ncbi:DGQHR domain-containing protein [Burkholderia gladioli]|uniref:DGQHR domain-containing protein n=1 Tax=Burkholderia gladioli TaxID=28095 RepID=UPI0016420DE9|nr:DGQHR domain-containing protein [Burkholderia gladioli]